MLLSNLSYNDYVAKVKLNRKHEDGNAIQHFENGCGSVVSVTFQVTEDCNMACTYCYQGHKSKNKMNFETAKLFIDKLLADDPSLKGIASPNKYMGIILEFIGGEPLLEIELIDAISTYFRTRVFELNHPWQNYYRISMTSNGTLYFDEKVQRFLRRHDGVVGMTVTIDGCKEVHDTCRLFPDGQPTYDVAIKAAQDIKKRYNLDSTKITISPDNVEKVFISLREMVEMGYTTINSNTVYEKGWTVEHAKILYKQLKMFADWFIEHDYDLANYYFREFRMSAVSYSPQRSAENHNFCGGVNHMLAIDYRGDIYRCIRYMKSSLGDAQEPYLIGNVWQGIGFDDVTRQRLLCMDCVTRRSQSTDECFYCPIGSGCGWCSAYNYQCTGTVNKRVTYTCIMHKAESMAAVYFMNKYAKLSKHSNAEEFAMDMWIPAEWALEIVDEAEYDMLAELTRENGKYVNTEYLQVTDDVIQAVLGYTCELPDTENCVTIEPEELDTKIGLSILNM